jgi:hypothetical protein
MEFLRGNPGPALTHLRGGWQFLTESNAQSSKSNNIHPLPSCDASASPQNIFQEIVLAFDRLRIQSLLVDPFVDAPEPD